MTALRPRTVFFLASFDSGGTEWFSLRLAKGLAQHGLTPLFLAAQAKGELADVIQSAFETETLSGTTYSFWGVMRLLPELVAYLREKRPDAIISGLPLLNIAMSLAVKLSGLRPRLLMVEHMRLCPHGPGQCGLRQRIKALMLRWAYQIADEVVSVSQTATDDLVRFNVLPADKIKTIPVPVVPDDIDLLCQKEPPHLWLREKTVPTLVAVGRLLPVKDYPTLLAAFALARKKKDMRLVIFGEGYERPALEKEIERLDLKNVVALAGATPFAFSAMSAASLFVLSSTSEAFGTVVAEALACGAPVVCTDCGGPREILEDGKWGTLVPPQNAPALAQAIGEALEKAPDREALKTRGRLYSVVRSVKAYLDLLCA